VRVTALFVAVTLLGVALVGTLIYAEQKAELEATLGAFLVNIARTGALLVDPALHAEVEAALTRDSEAYRRLRAALAAIQDENRIETPIYTLVDLDLAQRQARFMVTSRGPGAPGEPYPLVADLLEPLGRTFREGVATSTRVYRNQSGTWITAFAPIRSAEGRVVAVLDVDYRVDVYLTRLARLRARVVGASAIGAAVALIIGVLFARRLTGPLSALTRGVTQVAGGALGRSLPVRSRDEVGQLTQAFNTMLDGLRQRDFIRDTFGRYVSPDVARALLESPQGLKLGGEKRDVTVLMADLRGYTQFAEGADPAEVVRVLNQYLARMTTIVTDHGGTINEFMGDGIFAIFGAPLDRADHAERAAGCAIAMQEAMVEIGAAQAATGVPRFEMGIGLSSGEAVVGNIGSEQRAKYGVVGGTVNLAARVESCAVGGQVLLSPETHERIRSLAETGPPFTVELKGLPEPLALRELRALSGRWARRLPEPGEAGEVPVDPPRWVDVSLLEGKRVRPESMRGAVLRVGRRWLDLSLPVAVAPLANLRVRDGDPGEPPQLDLYVKVQSVRTEGDRWLVRAVLTSGEATPGALLARFARPERR
jgi:class 3 adenylate cyclase